MHSGTPKTRPLMFTQALAPILYEGVRYAVRPVPGGVEVDPAADPLDVARACFLLGKKAAWRLVPIMGVISATG